MSKLLRGLALVCLVLGVVCAVQTAVDSLYAFQAGVWFLLELVLLWLHTQYVSAKPEQLRELFAETVPSTHNSAESRQQVLSSVD